LISTCRTWLTQLQDSLRAGGRGAGLTRRPHLRLRVTRTATSTPTIWRP